MTTGPRVLISGAGIAGLATALRLHQIGWKPLVVEKAPVPRGGGYLINLSADGQAAAARLGILPELRRHEVHVRRFDYVTTRGRHRFSRGDAVAKAILGPSLLVLLRRDLEEVLRTTLGDAAEIRSGTRIQSITQHADGVHAVFDDGTGFDADLLIGADGLHSGVRELAFGPEQGFRIDLGIVVAAFQPPRLSAELSEHTVTRMSAPGRTVMTAGLGHGRAAAFFIYRSSSPIPDLAGGPRPALSRTFADFGWLVPDMLDRLPDADQVYFDSASQIATDEWSRRRVVLLGDAAWCTTLFAGAGASLALAGADLLATRLAHHAEIPAALTAWENELRPRVAHYQRVGRRNAARQAPDSRLNSWLSDLLLRVMTLRPATPLLRRRLQRHR